MSVIRITEQERSAIVETRPRYGGERNEREREANRQVFKQIKAKYGIPSNKKIAIEIDATSNPHYLVLKDKETGRPFEDLNARRGVPVEPAARPVEDWPYATPAAKPAQGYADPRVMPARASDAQLGQVAKPSHLLGAVAAGAREAAGPTLKLGSISLEDAVDLLRVEGDMCTSFATSSAVAKANVFVENGRLYFVM